MAAQKYTGGASAEARTAQSMTALSPGVGGTLACDDISTFPSGGEFVVKVDSEKMLVTRSVNTLTIVSRGYDGTSAATHANDRPIGHVWDAASAQRHEDHIFDPTAAHAASAISYAGASGIAATDVEGAIDELAAEKLGTSMDTLLGLLDAHGAFQEGDGISISFVVNVGSEDQFFIGANRDEIVFRDKVPVCIGVALSDETTAITTGTGKRTIRAPYAFTLTAVRLSVNTVSSSGIVRVDVNEGGASLFSTRPSIDANEKTSTTAATAAVISDSAIADDAELTFDIDDAGTGAKGLKAYLIGYRTVPLP